MPERIDAFTHVLTEHFYDVLVDEYEFKGLSGSPSWLWELEPRWEDMDDYGIDKQVINLALPPIWQGMDPEEALPLVQLANDEVARLADEHPDRFIPVGTLPFATDEYLAEFDRCVEDLDMAGVQIFTNVDGRPIDEAYDGLFGRAADAEAPLWLHPQLGTWADWLSEYMDHRLYGWPFDTTVALSRLVFSGVAVEHPDLDVIAHHGGAMVPFFGGRVTQFYETRLAYPDNYPGLEFPDFEKPPVEYLQAFHADTALGGSSTALNCATDFFGNDRVVFGTDYPFGPERGRRPLMQAVEMIDNASMSADERRGVYGGNLESLL